MLGRDVNKVGFGRFTLLPIRVGRGGEIKALYFAQRAHKHVFVKLLVDYGVPPFVELDETWSQIVVAEAAAALPVRRFSDAALVFSVDNLF